MRGDSVHSNSSLRERLSQALRFGSSDSDGRYTVEAGSSSYGSEDRCSTRKVVKTKCNTEEVEPGKFVRKCEKTQHIFRDCVGRPTELLESKTEYTENDVSRDSSIISNPLGDKWRLPEVEPYIPPVLRGEFDNFQRELFGGLESFARAAEEMAQDFFQSFMFPEDERETQNPFERFEGRDFERGFDTSTSERNHRGDKPCKEETDYADFAEEFEEI